MPTTAVPRGWATLRWAVHRSSQGCRASKAGFWTNTLPSPSQTLRTSMPASLTKNLHLRIPVLQIQEASAGPMQIGGVAAVGHRVVLWCLPAEAASIIRLAPLSLFNYLVELIGASVVALPSWVLSSLPSLLPTLQDRCKVPHRPKSAHWLQQRTLGPPGGPAVLTALRSKSGAASPIAASGRVHVWFGDVKPDPVRGHVVQAYRTRRTPPRSNSKPVGEKNLGL